MTRSKRIRLGWLVALAYLFCVFAPAAALAAGHAPAPCLDQMQTAAPAPAHHHGAHHVHDGGTMHDHASLPAHQQAAAQHLAAQDAPATHHRGGKDSSGPCCAMMCVTALPADLPDIAQPVQPTSTCAPEVALRVYSGARPQLYRPPIA